MQKHIDILFYYETKEKSIAFSTKTALFFRLGTRINDLLNPVPPV